MTTTATIDQLRPGHEYPGGGINSRKDYTSQQINDRLQSILVFGVLQSLCVCPAPGKTDPPFYVAAGGLRLAAIQLGIKTKKLAADFAIPVTIRTDWDSAMALAASLEENEQVLSPHPARVYETFAELVNRGKTPDDLIKLFPQLDAKEIRRILALGQLSPVIREAWLDEEIDADAAKAFTRAKDHKHQEDVFKRLKKQGQLQDWHIRDVLSGNERDGEKFLKFVGRKAYEDAGGKIHEDLFAQGRDEKLLVMDFPLLVRLVGEKIEAKCKELIEAGWSWAVDVDDLPSGAKFGWNKISGRPCEIVCMGSSLTVYDHVGAIAFAISADGVYLAPQYDAPELTPLFADEAARKVA